MGTEFATIDVMVHHIFHQATAALYCIVVIVATLNRSLDNIVNLNRSLDNIGNLNRSRNTLLI